MSEGRDVGGIEELLSSSLALAVAEPDCGPGLSETLTRVIMEEWDASRFASIVASGEMEMEMEKEFKSADMQ